MTLQHATTRTDSSPAVNHCPRCGRRLFGGRNVVTNHLNACREVPIPAELARIFQADTTLTVPDLAKRYGRSVSLIRGHLQRAGVSSALIRERGQAAQESGVKRGASWRQRARSRRLQGVGEKTCDKCGVLLKHPAVPKGRGDKCGWCLVGR